VNAKGWPEGWTIRVLDEQGRELPHVAVVEVAISDKEGQDYHLATVELSHAPSGVLVTFPVRAILRAPEILTAGADLLSFGPWRSPRRRPGPRPGQRAVFLEALTTYRRLQAETGGRRPRQQDVAVAMHYDSASILSRALRPLRWRDVEALRQRSVAEWRAELLAEIDEDSAIE
jgi:hypothetical protein